MSQPLPAPNPATPPAPAAGPPVPAPAPTPGAPVPPVPVEKAFSQADLDRIIGERLATKDRELTAATAKAKAWDDHQAANQPPEAKAAEAQVKAAEDAAYAKARGEFGGQLVEAHVTAAAAGRLTEPQRTALLLGLDRSRFLKQDGAVDTGAITTLIDGLAGPVPTGTPSPGQPPVPGGFGQGARPGAPIGGLAAGAAAYEATQAGKQASPLFS